MGQNLSGKLNKVLVCVMDYGRDLRPFSYFVFLL